MIRYPELIVNGHTNSGKTASVLAAAIAHKAKTGEETIFVCDEENQIALAERVLIANGVDVHADKALTDHAIAVLRNGPCLSSPDGLQKLLAKLNPTGEAGTKIAVFLDAPALCSLELNTSGSGNNGKRFRVGVNINEPLATLLKNYSVHAASIQNYVMSF